METVIITGYTAKSEGVILETNIPARLKPGRMLSKETFVSWDKIGNLLFENYTELEGVEKQYCMPEGIENKEDHEEYLKAIGIIKVYTTRILKDNKWQVIDQHEYAQFQGTETECLQWINLQRNCRLFRDLKNKL